jgi:L-2-hydroxyglutarate oxidase LhgO
VIAAKPQGTAPSAKERRRAAALAAAETAITTATLDQLEGVVERLQAFTIAARMARRPREEQAAKKALALAERRLGELRAGDR